MRSLFICCAIALAGPLSAQHTGTELLRSAHKKYYEGPCRYYTFSQKNTHYRNDSVVGNSEWHEAVGFPDKFRIRFGKKEFGNYILFRNDSMYRFKGGMLQKSGRDTTTLLLLLGGMYYRTFDDVVSRLSKCGYNVSLSSESVWNKEPVLILGTASPGAGGNQVWFDKATLRVVRIIEHEGDQEMDMRFEAHRPSCNGYMETKVSFRRNGKLEQTEEYFDIKETATFQEK